MKLRSRIKIRGRYGDDSFSVYRSSTHRFVFTAASPFIRYGFKDDGTLTFIDPSGGPFVHVGDWLHRIHSELPQERITSIKHIKDCTYEVCTAPSDPKTTTRSKRSKAT